MYLLNLDYETVDNLNKPALSERYKFLYSSQMESLYKGLLKHYSIKLADNLTPGAKEDVFNKNLLYFRRIYRKYFTIKNGART